ncbi:MAG: DNA-binding protein AsgB, partial [Myxococcaceae bacterium]|nr:DNA-binding protein AsgB [Myxococcaceae bacterium]
RSLPAEGPRGDGADAEALEVARPKTRGDCLPGGCNEQRPCPFVSCAAHLALEVRGHGSYATIKENFPGVEVWEMAETCALDVADRGGAALEEVAALLNLSPERAAQIEALATETATAPRGSRGGREP